MFSFKEGDTVDKDLLNDLITLTPFTMCFVGTQRDAKTGAGVTENLISDYSRCARFTLVSSTTLSRIELELQKLSGGADLIVQIRSGMVPESGIDGSLIKEVCIPFEFISATKGYVSIPIGLTGLTSGGTYWIVVTKAGDATNHISWFGESSQDGSYPCFYRAGSTGNWTANNALHFKIYSNEPSAIANHCIIDGNAHTTYEYSGGLVSKMYRYVPEESGYAGGVRSILTLSQSNGYITGGV